MADRRPAVDGETCCKFVAHGRAGVHVCGKRARIVEDGRAFCGVHDPQKERDTAAKRAARWADADAAFEAEFRRRAARTALVRAVLAWGAAREGGAPLDSDPVVATHATLVDAIKAAKAAGVTG